MIFISKTAKSHFSKLLKKQEKGTQIRITVINPGKLNAKYSIAYCPLNAVKKNDIALKFGKLIIYIDEYSSSYLKDTKIDFVTSRIGSKLVFTKKNTKIDKINKNIPLVVRVEHFLQSEINPQLSNHGGTITLVKITNDNYAFLRFGGNCNGCAMVTTTLKEGIEKQLLNEFPELKGVLDVTHSPVT